MITETPRFQRSIEEYRKQVIASEVTSQGRKAKKSEKPTLNKQLTADELAGRRRRMIMVGVSLQVYSVAFVCPGYMPDIGLAETNLNRPCWGVEMFFVSLFGVWIVPVWMANPLYWYSLRQFYLGRFQRVLICISVAMVGVIASLFFGFGVAYVVWAISIAILVPAVFLEAKDYERTPFRTVETAAAYGIYNESCEVGVQRSLGRARLNCELVFEEYLRRKTQPFHHGGSYHGFGLVFDP